MELKYDDITAEQWEIYVAVEKACKVADLQQILEEDYERKIEDFSKEEINMVIELYDNYKDNCGEWREDMKLAINRTLDI